MPKKESSAGSNHARTSNKTASDGKVKSSNGGSGRKKKRKTTAKRATSAIHLLDQDTINEIQRVFRQYSEPSNITSKKSKKQKRTEKAGDGSPTNADGGGK